MFEGEPVAFVTGGGSGIGKSAAVRFGEKGCRVAVIDRDAAAMNTTLELLESRGTRAIGVQADVSVDEDVRVATERTYEDLGGLDFAFNNAGIGGLHKSLLDHTYDEFLTMLSVNLVGVWLCMKYELKFMLPQRRGVIVNTASTLGLRGFANVSAYVASKHGVVGLTKAAAIEYAAQGIRINCVCPGHTRTPINEDYWKEHPDIEAFQRGQAPARRFADPEEIAAAVTWLCSDSASFVHGHSLVVDGGMTIVAG